MEIPEGYFRQAYTLKGSDWIRSIAPEDRSALLHYVRSKGQYGRLGGKARAATGLRCARCKQFASESQLNQHGNHINAAQCEESIARHRAYLGRKND